VTGMPIFINKKEFIMLIVFDMISLLASVTEVLIDIRGHSDIALVGFECVTQSSDDLPLW